jgi:hypothetical protein
MAERFKFEKVPRPDGLEEEQIIDSADQPIRFTGDEGEVIEEQPLPLHHSIGMPIFQSQAEKEAWLKIHNDETEDSRLKGVKPKGKT